MRRASLLLLLLLSACGQSGALYLPDAAPSVPGATPEAPVDAEKTEEERKAAPLGAPEENQTDVP